MFLLNLLRIIPLYQPEEEYIRSQLSIDRDGKSFREKFESRENSVARIESNRVESKVSMNERKGGGKKGDETGQRNGAQDRSMCKNDSQRIHYPERN